MCSCRDVSKEYKCGSDQNIIDSEVLYKYRYGNDIEVHTEVTQERTGIEVISKQCKGRRHQGRPLKRLLNVRAERVDK